MAEQKISARDWLVFISEDSGVSYKPVACLTSNEFTSSNSPIDVTSKCGDEMVPGVKFEQSISMEGFTITESGTPTKASTSKLYDLHVDKTEFLVRIAKANPTGQDNKYEGTVFINEWSESAPDAEYNTFSCTMTVKNPPLTLVGGY